FSGAGNGMSAMRVLRFASAARAGSVSRPSSLWRPTKCAWMFGRRPGAPCSDTANTSVPWKESLQDTTRLYSKSGRLSRVIDTRGGRVLDEFPEALDGERGGAALVDDGSHARANADLIRVHSEVPGDVLVDVAVCIDHAGDDETVPRVDRAGGRARDPRRHL